MLGKVLITVHRKLFILLVILYLLQTEGGSLAVVVSSLSVCNFLYHQVCMRVLLSQLL